MGPNYLSGQELYIKMKLKENVQLKPQNTLMLHT